MSLLLKSKILAQNSPPPYLRELEFEDHQGIKRHDIRVKWWLNSIPETFREVVFPYSTDVPNQGVPDSAPLGLPGYAPTEPPVFFGHYWLPGDTPLAPQTPNVCCLDYSIANQGRLAAYRWDGEMALRVDKMVAVP